MRRTSQLPTSAASGRRARAGFTLIEILVVITIIAILSGLVTSAALMARSRAINVRMKTEVDQLDAALKNFKAKYGSYPPCDMRYGIPAVKQNLDSFVLRLFPRYKLANLATDLQACDFDISGTAEFRPDLALVFWLRGFSPDPTAPFTGPGQREAFHDFDKARLRPAQWHNDANNNGQIDIGETFNAQVYVPSGGQDAPYVYFDSRSYGTLDKSSLPSSAANSVPTTFAAISAPADGTTGSPLEHPVPYVMDADGDGELDTSEGWANPDTFQIICAGQDGHYGDSPNPFSAPQLLRYYPIGTNYDPDGHDNDNITNFCEKGTLEDAKP